MAHREPDSMRRRDLFSFHATRWRRRRARRLRPPASVFRAASASMKPRQDRQAARGCLCGADQYADRRRVGLGMDRQTDIAPKSAASAASTSPSPSARQISVSVPAGREKPRRGGDPPSSVSSEAGVRQSLRPRSGDGLWCGDVERRIYQNMRSPSPRAVPRRSNDATGAGRRRGRSRARVRQGRCARHLSRASAASAGSISTRVTARPSTRRASASPAAPTPAPRSTACSPAPRRHRRREQDGIVADAMAAPRLAQHKPAAEHGILGRVHRGHVHATAFSGHRGAARCRSRPPPEAVAPPRTRPRRPECGAGKMPIEPSSTLMF